MDSSDSENDAIVALNISAAAAIISIAQDLESREKSNKGVDQSPIKCRIGSSMFERSAIN